MSTTNQLLQIRTKKLGLLILDARSVSRRSVEDCAEAMQVTPEEYRAFESGKRAPSLPQLELLALQLKIPVEYFWGRQALSATTAAQPIQDRERLLQLRNRMIGASLRMARTKANLTLDDVAERAGVPAEQLRQYEMGLAAAPVTELDAITAALDVGVEQYYDQHGPVGRWRSEQGALEKFVEMPPELQQFITRPVNRPYLELAMRLSEMSADKLRAVAEVLLEITY